MDLATTAIPTPTGAVRREKQLLKPMLLLTLTTATTDIDTATIPTMATATGEGRRGPRTLRLFPTPSLLPIPTLRRMPTTDTTAMADGIIPTMDTPGPTTTDTTGARI